MMCAGHGGQTKDLDGDEDDGYDEVIYPVDFRTAGHIVDDEMHRIMVAPLQPGVRLTAIFDSCHSGSALDLPYIYSTQGVLKEPNLAKEAGQGLLGIVSSYARNDIGGMLSTASSLFKKVTSGDDVYKKNLRTKTSPADVIMWSGSKDQQTSYVLPPHPPSTPPTNQLTQPPQSRRLHRRRSHGGHVMGLHHGAAQEPQPELRAAAQQHPRRARGQVPPEAAAELQPPVE